MSFTVTRCDMRRVELKTRMPFRYGIATMTQMPLVFVRAWLTDGRQEKVGVSSDLLPPKWFTKVPDKPPAEEIDEMVEVISHAQTAVVALRGETPFDLWQRLYAAQDAWAKSAGIAPLLAHFGTSLVERAMLESACRLLGQPFHALVQSGSLGIDLARLHPELQGQTPAQFLPEHPRGAVVARHTIGLSDPLRDEDIAPADQLQDRLPQSLTACIRRYGLRHFKIKVNGQPASDLERLEQISRILQTETGGLYAFSLDGNEQFKTMDAFQDFWGQVQSRLGAVLDHLLFVEQPVHRDHALAPSVGETLRGWKNRPRLIIDESDGALEDLPRALALGYDGTSHKNCKGIFKGLGHRCLLALQPPASGSRAPLMSGEDLCNVGPIALPQDLAMMALLGIESVERNGHHYNAGLSQFPQPVREQVLRSHPDLYQRSPLGWPTLRIEQGQIQLGSVNRAHFGVDDALTQAVLEATEP